MQLNVLANGEIADTVGIAAGEVRDHAQLLRAHDSVRNPDAHHEALQGAADASLSSGDSSAIALRVDAPPAEICADPLGRNGRESFASEAADLGQPPPWVLRALETFDALRCSLFPRIRLRACRHVVRLLPDFSGKKKPTARCAGGG